MVTKETKELNELNLEKEFPGHSFEEWKNAATALLKGAPFEKKLLTKTYEGITLQPIYMKDDLAKAKHYENSLEYLPQENDFVRSSNASGKVKELWKISGPCFSKDENEFNKIALQMIERGQNELYIKFEDNQQIFASQKAFAKAFEGIDLQKVSTYFSVGKRAKIIFNMFVNLCEEKKFNLKKVEATFEFDAFREALSSSESSISYSCFLESVKTMLETITNKNLNNFKTLVVNSDIYHNGGASSVEELGFGLATFSEYFKSLKNIDRNFKIEKLGKTQKWNLSIGGNFFMEIAKIRAARILLTKLYKNFEGDPKDLSLQIHATTGLWNKSILDKNVNILRTSTECFSAVVGGADAITVLPFDYLNNNLCDSELSRRVARNINFLLGDESNLRNVIDPAGGAYSIEVLTQELVDGAWKIYQEIESAGGMKEALAKKIPQEKVFKTKNERIKNLAFRRDVFVGVNMYPNISEEIAEDNFSAFKNRMHEHQKQRFNCTICKDNGHKLNEVLNLSPIENDRIASIFEELRIAANVYKKKHKESPKIFQANLGATRNFRARADWTAGFFEVGGFQVINQFEHENLVDIVNEIKKSNALLAVITGTDEKYQEAISTIVPMIKKETPNVTILVAGSAGEAEAKWRELGVSEFINVTCNCYEILKKLLVKVGAL